MDRNTVKNIVISEIKKCAPELCNITESTRIVEDIKISGDDDMFLIWDIEKKTGLKPPRAKWKNVKTVGDIIDLITAHIPEDMQ